MFLENLSEACFERLTIFLCTARYSSAAKIAADYSVAEARIKLSESNTISTRPEWGKSFVLIG